MGLLEKLNEIFEADDFIEELGVIFTTSLEFFTQGKDPKDSQTCTEKDKTQEKEEAPFLLHDHKLGILQSCIQPLYMEALSLYNKSRQEYTAWERSQTEKNKKNSRMDHQLVIDLIYSTRALLLICADHYTAWNTRKVLISSGYMGSLQEGAANEIRFLNLVFSKHPKVSCAWEHRKWTLSHLPCFQRRKPLGSSDPGTRTTASICGCGVEYTACQVVQREFATCSKASKLYPHLYYAWAHRLWVVRTINVASLAEQEIYTSREWTDSHVSDHCSYRYRHSLFVLIAMHSGTMAEESELCVENLKLHEGSHSNAEDGKDQDPSHDSFLRLLDSEISYSNELIDVYPGHESMWHQRRSLLLLRLHYLCRCYAIYQTLSVDEIWNMLESEYKFAHLCSTDDGVCDYEKQWRFSTCFKLWCLYWCVMYMREAGPKGQSHCQNKIGNRVTEDGDKDDNDEEMLLNRQWDMQRVKEMFVMTCEQLVENVPTQKLVWNHLKNQIAQV